MRAAFNVDTPFCPNRSDNDGVASNGCEFEPDPNAIYVQTPENGGVDAPECGSPLAPCATINQGLARRTQAQSFALVLVAEGAYRETVSLVEGINVLGGHQRINWERNPSVFASVIFGNDAGNTHKAAVRRKHKDPRKPVSTDSSLTENLSCSMPTPTAFTLAIQTKSYSLQITVFMRAMEVSEATVNPVQADFRDKTVLMDERQCCKTSL